MGKWHIVYCSCGRSLKPSPRTKQFGQEDLRRFLNSRLRHQKEPHPWCQTWSFRAATSVQQSQGDAAESSPTQAWWLQNHFGKMTRTASLCQILGGLRSRLFSMTKLHSEDHSYMATREERTRSEKNFEQCRARRKVQSADLRGRGSATRRSRRRTRVATHAARFTTMPRSATTNQRNHALEETASSRAERGGVRGWGWGLPDHAKHASERAETNTWVSTWTGGYPRDR